MNLFETFLARGLIHDHTDSSALTSFLESPQKVYAGFDPTADSLHLGNLVPIVALRHFQQAGHTPIIVIGGATGLIGDPSGKASERKLLSAKQVELNLQSIKCCLNSFLSFEGENSAIILNNYDWLSSYSHIDWLRDIGKYFTINSMLSKDSVASRLESGVTYTEFSYSLLQAFDFLYLNRTYGCNIQIGGSDQWGNITSGTQLIRKLEAKTVHGLTFPILETSDGEKFGKSEGNAIWLDKNKTSPYRLYQYLLNITDTDTDILLRMLTFLPLDEISRLNSARDRNPQSREGQKALAEALVEFIHGKDELVRAQKISQVFFSEHYSILSSKEIADIFDEEDTFRLSAEHLDSDNDEKSAVSMLIECGIFSSKNRVRQLLEQGGLSVNGKSLSLTSHSISRDDFLHGQYLIVKRGKKSYYLIKTLNEATVSL